MATYGLVASYSTVQVITPTLVQPIQYTTIRTNPSNVIASIALDQLDFQAGTSGPLLAAFADAIEVIMSRPEVIAGIGTQTLDANGLLQDFVTFTVQYVSANTAPSGVTAEADVPVGLLSTMETFGGQTNMPAAEAIITTVYDALAAAAAG